MNSSKTLNNFHCLFSVPGFSDSDESAAIEDLLDAYEKSDVEEMQKVTSKAMFTYMDNEVCVTRQQNFGV